MPFVFLRLLMLSGLGLAAGGRLRLALRETRLELTTQPTAMANVFQRFVAGVVTLPAGTATLRAEVVAAPATVELMPLNRVWLRRMN
jgi:hypothetical protein